MATGFPPLTPGAPAAPGWRWRILLWAPHRLGFAAAVVVMLAASAWWAWVLFSRVWPLVALPLALPPILVHGAIMTLGFMPLFVAGFAFTAGPKWLAVAPPPARALLAPVILQVAGWAAWLTGAHGGVWWAAPGLLAAALGQALVAARFTGLIGRSRADDRWHAGIIAVASWVAVVHLLALAYAVVVQAIPHALVLVRSAVWLSIVPVFISALHRLVPFFTSSALPMVDLWRPWWVLVVLLGAALVEAAFEWGGGGLQDAAATRGVMLARGLFELVIGSIVLWLALVWGLVQALRIRLLAMLHLGVLWLGLAYCLLGAAQLLGLKQGVPLLGLGAWHALTMGFLGSILYAMVTRVSCGHGGRKLLADEATWWGFWVLQGSVVLRVGSAMWPDEAVGLLLAVSTWCAALIPWGMRLLSWYGRPRPDGRPG
ncbi:MAG: NnrS family protein [Pseudomonadota bacterium]